MTGTDDERKRTKPNPPARAYERELSSGSKHRNLVGKPAVHDGGPPAPLLADMARQSMLAFAGLNTARYRATSLTSAAGGHQYHERGREFDADYSFQRYELKKRQSCVLTSDVFKDFLCQGILD